MKGIYITLILFAIMIMVANWRMPERKKDIISKKRKKRELATYEERIMWFLKNYYESGMEYDILLVSMEGADLDNFEWYDDIIHIPKYKDELDE
tara:strand:- start:3714 stop:3995 length:282 start_codon:yes stop_codon:yes gene_type:complete